jgi:hypothetical protein
METIPRSRDLVIIGALALTLLWNGLCSLLSPGWIGASIITALNWLIFVAYFLWSRDRLTGRLLLLALVAGWTELLADRWLVDVTETLVFQSGGPFVVRSPLYMPFAWGVVLVQTAYIGWRLSKTINLGWAMVLTGLLGAATIPLYEWWAKGANWWFYQNTRMWGPVPLYIILGEFLIAAGVVLLMWKVEERPWWLAPILGLVQGLWIWVSYALAFALVG